MPANYLHGAEADNSSWYKTRRPTAPNVPSYASQTGYTWVLGPFSKDMLSKTLPASNLQNGGKASADRENIQLAWMKGPLF